MSDQTLTGNQHLLEKITSRFPGISNPTEPFDLLTIEFPANSLLELFGFLKNELGFTYLTDLCGIHFPGGHLNWPIESGILSTEKAISSDLESAGHGTGSGYSTESSIGTAYDQGFNTPGDNQNQSNSSDKSLGQSIENQLRPLGTKVDYATILQQSTLRGDEQIPDTKGELGVVYHLHALETNTRIRLKTFFPASSPEIDSLTPLFKGANWMERETYDFYGIIFKGHPDLRRILNVDEMIAFPMRKEFPLEDQNRKDKQDQFFGR